MRKIIHIIFLSVLLASVGIAQAIPSEITKLIPLQTDRTEVEKLLGKPENYFPNFGVYRTDFGRFHVHYASGTCPRDSDGANYWKVTQGRMTNFVVYLNNSLPLASYVSDTSNLIRSRSPGGFSRIHYSSSDQSIIYETIVRPDESEFVYNIAFQPGRDKRQFLCNK